MDDQTEFKQIAKSLRTLTVAVWCLVATGVLQMAAWLAPLLAPNFFMRHAASSAGIPSQAFESWDGLSLEEKIKRSNMIIVTENKRDGDKLRAIIKEIPKQDHDIEFHYAIGQEYLPLTVTTQKDTRYGEGYLVLLQGSSATRRQSFAIYNGSIPGLNDLPLTKVRDIIAKSK